MYAERGGGHQHLEERSPRRIGYEQEVVINPDLGALSDVLVTELSCDNDDGDLISKYAALRGSDQLSEVVF